MRPLELVVAVTSVIALAVIATPGLRAYRQFGHLPILPTITAFAQVTVEGSRWQMVPTYCLSGALLCVWLWRLRGTSRRLPTAQHPERRRWRRPLARLAFGAGTIMLTASVALATAFPVFHFPQPRGPYAIGTITYHWVDSERHEIFSADPSTKRELMAQVWYPALPGTTAQRAPYVRDATAISTGLAANLSASGLLRLPNFMFDYFGYVETNAVPGAVVAENVSDDEAGFPVLIYLTGFSGWSSTNTLQVQELVSHGYVVVGLDQPYTAAAVTFPDGTVVQALDRARERKLVDQSIVPVNPALELNGLPLEDGIIPYLAEDVSFTLNRLADINAGRGEAAELADVDGGDLADADGNLADADGNLAGEDGVLAGKLDLNSVGVFGVSLGAMAGAQSCHNDLRLKACLMVDAAMPVAVVESGLTQPAMWVTRDADVMRLEREKSGGWSEDEIRMTQHTMRDTFGKSTSPSKYFVDVPGAFHVDFTDAPLWTPINKQLGLSGPQGAQTPEILGAYVKAFFDEALRSRPAPLLDGTLKPYPGVVVRSDPTVKK